MSERKYNQLEDSVYPILTHAFTEGTLVNERHGAFDWVSIDWAEAVSGDQDVRVGSYHFVDNNMGLIISPADTDVLYWIRSSFGDLCTFADQDIEMPIALNPGWRARRAASAMIRNLRPADRSPLSQ